MYESKSIKRACKSSYGAELLATSSAVDAQMYALAFMEQLGVVCYGVLLTDSLTVYRHTHSSLLRLPEEKSLAPDLLYLRGQIERHGIRMMWIDGRLSQADALTKRVSQEQLLNMLYGAEFKLAMNAKLKPVEEY